MNRFGSGLIGAFLIGLSGVLGNPSLVDGVTFFVGLAFVIRSVDR